MVDQDRKVLDYYNSAIFPPIMGVDLCIFEAAKIRDIFIGRMANFPLDTVKKYSFQKIWDNQIQKPLERGKQPTIKSLSAFYSASIAVVYQEALGLKNPYEATREAQKVGDIIGSDSKKYGKRQFDVAFDALKSKSSELRQSASFKEALKYTALNKALSGAARLGLSIAIMEGVEEDDLAKSIITKPFLKTETHINDVKSSKELLGDTLDKYNARTVVGITQTSHLFKALEDKDKSLVNNTLKDLYSFAALDAINFFVKGEGRRAVGPAHKLTLQTLKPDQIYIDSRQQHISGVQVGIGIIRNNKPAEGLPLFGMINFLMQAEHTRKAFGFEGKSTIIVSQPHDELADELGEAAREREQKTFDFVQNLLSNLPGRKAKFYQIYKKEDFTNSSEFKPKCIDDFTSEQQAKILQPVPDDKDVAYFLMESAMLDCLNETFNNSVKVSWTNGKRECTEHNFDEVHEAVKDITTNGSGMGYVYFEAPHSFTGKTLAPYAVSEDEAEKTILLEDLEQDDDRKYIEKAKIDLGIDGAIKVAEAQKYGFFGTKLAYLMLKHGSEKDGKKAVSEMLTTIRNMKLVTGDYNIGLPEDNPNVGTSPEKMSDTHKFICDNMSYIYESYLREPNKKALAANRSGEAFARTALSQSNTIPPERIPDSAINPDIMGKEVQDRRSNMRA